LAAAMLAGVLLRFGINAFAAAEEALLLVSLMIATYLIGKIFLTRYVIPLTFLSGVMVAMLTGSMGDAQLNLSVTTPIWMMPEFSLSAMIGVGLPLFVVTMASQNLPGIATLRAHGYETPASPLVGWSGFTGILLAPFGGYAFNLGAITAAICMTETTDPDPSERYRATIWAGIFYIIMGIFGGAVTGLFILFPDALIMAIAGLALLGTIGNSLHTALDNQNSREAALITFLVTASGFSLFSIGAPFWGIVLGTAIYYLQRRTAKA